MPDIIDEMYAFIMKGGDPKYPEDEGVTAVLSGGQWIPMVGADMTRVESLKKAAQTISTAMGKPITIVKFSTRTEVEVIQPEV